MAIGLVLASASPRRREILSYLNVPFMVEPANVDETPLVGESPAAMVLRLSRAKAAELSSRLADLSADAQAATATSKQDAGVIRPRAEHSVNAATRSIGNIAADMKSSAAHSARALATNAADSTKSTASTALDMATSAADAKLSAASISRDVVIIAADAKLSAAGISQEVVVIAADTTVALDGLIIGKPTDAVDAEQILRRLRGRMHQVFTGLTLASSQGREWSALCETRVYMRAYGDDELLAYVASGEVYDKAGAYAIQDELFHPVERIEGCYMNVMGLPLCEVIRGLRALGIETDKSEPIPHDYQLTSKPND